MSKPTPLVFWLLAAGVTSASAMSLGPTPDTVSVGRGLDLRFPIQGDGREMDGSLCLSVDVRYGDDRIPDGTAILENTGGGASFVRVRTSAPVNEPIVSVRLQAGCDQPLSRSYTLLAAAPVQTGASAGLPVIGAASTSAVAPPRATVRPLPSDGDRPRAPQATRAAAPARSTTSTPTGAAPVRPRPAASAPRAETGAGANPRSVRGPVASTAAPAPSASQPVLKLEDPAYFGQSPGTPKQGEASVDRPTGGTTSDAGTAAPAPAAPAAVAEDQVALMRAELAAARKEIARLQAAVTARPAPPPEDTDYQPYLIAAFGGLLAAAAGAWALRRSRRRKTEAGAWWHGSHSMQAPLASQAPASVAPASAPDSIDLGSSAAHDLAYPVSMLPEDLERSSMFPDFVRQDARSTLTPYEESAVTLPGEPAEEVPRRSVAAHHDASAAAIAGMATSSAASLAAEASRAQASTTIAPMPLPAPSDEPPAQAAAYWKEEPKYRELDLDLDVDTEPADQQHPPAPAFAAPDAPARLDEGNLIDFEATGLGGYLKPASRERQD